VWTVLLLSLAFRLALLAAMLAFVGWLVFSALERDLVGGLAVLLPGFVVLCIAFYIGARLARKHARQLAEYQHRLRAGREAAGRPSEQSENNVEQR